jgi:hypothetical protein
MFFIFGWGRQLRKNFGAVLSLKCSHCNNESFWNLFRVSTWFTLFFIPVIPYSIEKYLLCPVCQYGIELDNDKFKKFKEIADINKDLASGLISQAEHNVKVEGLLSEEKTTEVIMQNEVPVLANASNYCVGCGNKVSSESIFCKHCGNKLN